MNALRILIAERLQPQSSVPEWTWTLYDDCTPLARAEYGYGSPNTAARHARKFCQTIGVKIPVKKPTETR